MKITCEKCSTINPEGSQFCKECGQKLQLSNEATDEPKQTVSPPPQTTTQNDNPTKEESTETLLFIPTKEKPSLFNRIAKLFLYLIIAGLVIVVLFLGIIWLDEISNSDTSSNFDNSVIDTTSSESEYAPTIYNLELVNVDSEWGGYQEETFYLKGTVRNNNSVAVQDVQIRVDFTRDEAGEDLLDTRYVTITGVSANGAYTFKEPIYNINIEGQFWYYAQISNGYY